MVILRLNKGDFSGLMMSVITAHSTLRLHLKRIEVVDRNECTTWGEDSNVLDYFLCLQSAFVS